MPSTHVINDFIAGSFGGAAGVFAGHPFDTLKVQIQTQEFGGKYANIWEAIGTIKSQSLTRGFFRGLSWPLLSFGGVNAIFFGTYGLTLKKLEYVDDTDKPPDYFAVGVASLAATIPMLIILCPVEVIKTTLQSQIPHRKGVSAIQQQFYKGPIEASKNVIKSAGLKGMYRGLLTQTVRDGPANILYMLCYAMFQYESSIRFPSVPSQVVNFIGGGIAGVVSWSIIMPFDVVKSKLQADTSKLVYKGFWDCSRRIYMSGGVKGFFIGFLPVMMRAFPLNAIQLMVYSECLIYLNKL